MRLDNGNVRFDVGIVNDDTGYIVRLGAVMLGDEMIDEASRKMAVKFVARGERAGLGAS